MFEEHHSHSGMYILLGASIALTIPFIFYMKCISDSLKEIAEATKKEANTPQ